MRDTTLRLVSGTALGLSSRDRCWMDLRETLTANHGSCGHLRKLEGRSYRSQACMSISSRYMIAWREMYISQSLRQQNRKDCRLRVTSRQRLVRLKHPTPD